MGGICGWAPSGGPLTGGPLPRAGSGAALSEAMAGALAHRGHVAWLDAASPAEEPGPVVADSAFNTPRDLARAWGASAGDPAGFTSPLAGSFAAAALDRRRGRLVLARDRLGEKPLYYIASPVGVAFASEIKALRAAGFVFPDDLDPVALDAFLAFTYIPAPWTIFRHVRTVPAGHTVTIDLPALSSGSPGAVQATCYWKLPDRAGLGATAGDMLSRLGEALQRRLPERGDVTAFLSGGLDSSVVTMLAARSLGSGRTLHCLSASFREARLDESAHARRVARLAGARHHEVPLHEVDAGLVHRVLHHLDQPMADAATLPTWVMAREAAALCGEGGTVAMTGDGADALLAGDHWFRRLQSLDRMERWPRAARRLLTAASALAGGARHRRQAAREALLDLPPAERYLAIRQKWTPAERLAVYTPEFASRVQLSAVASTYLDAPVPWQHGGSVDAAVRLDARHGLPEGLLMKGDKMGMAHGVETRSPFMDSAFAAWCAQLDMRLLLRGGQGKRLLKEAAARLLPRDLVWRRKQGLQVPLGRWLRGPLRELTEAAFEPARLAVRGVFDPRALARLKKRFDEGPSTPALDGRIWQIVSLQTWWDAGSPRISEKDVMTPTRREER